MKWFSPDALMTHLAALAFFAAGATAQTPPAPVAPVAQHVVILGIDGARPDALQQAAGPVLRDLIAQGTVCWTAQAEHPTVTQVNWPSMLTGSRPATHGIDRHPVTEEELAAEKVRVPTVFERVAEHGGQAIAFLGHWKLHTLERPAPNATFIRSPYRARQVAPLAAAHLRTHRPALTFVWMGDLDGLGHKHGWMSPEQLVGVADLDAAIGQIVAALHDTGMWATTLLVIASDHGGTGRSHGRGTPEDATIPWIAVGPGVPPGQVIERPLSICDTAPTVLAALGLPIPEVWDGSVVNEIFAPPTTPPALQAEHPPTR